MSPRLIIVGAGGHAAVVADALLGAGREVIGFTDADRSLHGSRVCGLPVLGDDAALEGYPSKDTELVNGLGGVGDARTTGLRRTVQQRLTSAGWRFSEVRHASAVVSRLAQVGRAAQLLAACVVQVRARLGEGCIVNTASVVEHDVEIGDWVHVAPRALVCGDVKVGARSHVGAGAVIRQGLRLGEDTVVAAGAVVVKDFAGHGVLMGVPARPVERQR